MSDEIAATPTASTGWSASIQAFIRRRRRTLLGLWLISMVAVVVGSLVPELAPPEGRIAFLPIDKLIHVGAYAGLAFLPQVALARFRPATVAALSMILLGGAIEIAQSFTPGREGSFDDAIANALGVLAGIALGLRMCPPGT